MDEETSERIEDLESQIEELREALADTNEEVDILEAELENKQSEIIDAHKEGYDEGLADAIKAIEKLQ